MNALAGCKQLQTLALAWGYPHYTQIPAIPAMLQTISLLKNLRILSLSFEVRCQELAPLSSLVHLVTLAVSRLLGPVDAEMQLTSVCLLQGMLRSHAGPSRPAGGPAGWQPCMQSYINVGTLSAFPNVELLEDVVIGGLYSTDDGAYMPIRHRPGGAG